MVATACSFFRLHYTLVSYLHKTFEYSIAFHKRYPSIFMLTLRAFRNVCVLTSYLYRVIANSRVMKIIRFFYNVVPSYK